MEIQSDINLMSMWSDDAAEQMKIVIDRRCSGPIRRAGSCTQPTPRTWASPLARSPQTSTSASPAPPSLSCRATRLPVRSRSSTCILRMGQALDEQNIPETGRWVVMPTWAATMVKKSELRDAASDRRRGLHSAERPAGDARPIHDLFVEPAPGRRCWHPGGRRIRDVCGSCSRPHVRVADDQARDASLRDDLRHALARACRCSARRCSTARRWRKRSSSEADRALPRR